MEVANVAANMLQSLVKGHLEYKHYQQKLRASRQLQCVAVLFSFFIIIIIILCFAFLFSSAVFLWSSFFFGPLS